jgi:flavin-dependent dehydrogenase
MATKFDAIVIGTGQAGPSLTVRLAGTGMKVAIIERKRDARSRAYFFLYFSFKEMKSAP